MGGVPYTVPSGGQWKQDPCRASRLSRVTRIEHFEDEVETQSTRRTSTSHITVHTLTHTDHSKYTVCVAMSLSPHTQDTCPGTLDLIKRVVPPLPSPLCRLRRVAATARSHTTSPVPFIPLACSEAGRPRHAAMRLSPHPIHTAQLSMPAEIAPIDHTAAPPPAACLARPHAARPPPRPSPFTPLTLHPSRLTPRPSPLAPRASRLTPRRAPPRARVARRWLRRARPAAGRGAAARGPASSPAAG